MFVTLLCLCCHVYAKDDVRVSPPSRYSCPTFINKVHKPEKREAFGRTGLPKVVACLDVIVVTGALSHRKPASVFILLSHLKLLLFSRGNSEC